MTPAELKGFRDNLGLSQAELGAVIGMSARSITAMETGQQKIRKIHVMALNWASLHIAVASGDAGKATDQARHDAPMLTKLIEDAVSVLRGKRSA